VEVFFVTDNFRRYGLLAGLRWLAGRATSCQIAAVRQMSLSARDRHALHVIKDGLAGSDPDLAGLLATFARLTAGETMPACEQIRARWRPITGTKRHAATQRTGRPARRVGPAGMVMLAWLVITAVLVSLAVVVGSGSPAPCKMSWAMGCAQPAPSAPVHANGS
jgi:hypothetical protein